MALTIRSRMSSLLRSKAPLPLVGSYVNGDSWWCLPVCGSASTRGCPKFMNWVKMDGCRAAASLPSFKEKQQEVPSNCVRPSRENKGLDVRYMAEADDNQYLFGLMKQRFLSFKDQKYIKELGHFQALAEAQSPKNGPSECNAALEFAVTTLQVENILVIGHSSCAGVETLMRMQENAESRNFINKWVINGRIAKLRTKAATAHLSFDQQCRFCEKESINQSLVNLLSYPWIEDRVRRELLSLHGGYYNFSNCSFEKWTLDFKECNVKEEGSSYAVKEQEFWC
ncbi:beta carbonic anhydrase 5, chloroplastic-like isoform X2 [Abrus precatorius]|uniref:Carbonic anhydrase n=1 Tax=Abrus precatorius TaxID=3816 RepID=A0A8B8JG27_ABRPR|nr:beta carbonic anhydrase 5, chloroplastic-like isoform X2 [Abrus precatorius]